MDVESRPAEKAPAAAWKASTVREALAQLSAAARQPQLSTPAALPQTGWDAEACACCAGFAIGGCAPCESDDESEGSPEDMDV